MVIVQLYIYRKDIRDLEDFKKLFLNQSISFIFKKRVDVDRFYIQKKKINLQYKKDIE